MTTLIILAAVIGAAALRAGGILPRNEPSAHAHPSSVRHIPTL